MRGTWTVATISKDHVQLWYLKRSQHACQCTPLVSFSLSTTSPGFQMWHRWLASTSQVGISMCGISASDLIWRRIILLWALRVLLFKEQSDGVPACLSPKCLVLQALGYLPPDLPSTISFGDEQRMHVTAKVCDNSSKLESSSMLHGKVMVFFGKLSDNSPGVAKLPATDASLKQEVWVHHVSTVADLLGCCCALLHRQKQAQSDCAGKQSL